MANRLLVVCFPLVLCSAVIVAEHSNQTSASIDQLLAQCKTLGSTVSNLASSVLQLQATVEQDKLEISDLKTTVQQQNSRILDLKSCQTTCAEDAQYPVVAFSTFMRQDANNMLDGQLFVFDGILLNHGNGYDVNTGVFTVPESGTYLFSFFVAAYTGSSRSEVIGRLVLDGNNMVDAIAEVAGQGMNDQGGNVVILDLTEGQKVWIEEHDHVGSINSSDMFRFASFSGHRL